MDRSQQKVPGAVRGLAVLGPHLYWVDPAQQLIERVDKHTGQEPRTVVSRTEGLTAIAAVANLTRKVSQGQRNAVESGESRKDPVCSGAKIISHKKLKGSEGVQDRRGRR